MQDIDELSPNEKLELLATKVEEIIALQLAAQASLPAEMQLAALNSMQAQLAFNAPRQGGVLVALAAAYRSLKAPETGFSMPENAPVTEGE
jgi:uncharacterized protein YijF (DUF1287 family)